MVWLTSPARGQGLTTIASFNGTNGFQIYGGVTVDADGDLFGTSEYGGANNKGTVWEIAKGSSTITTLASFGGSNGAYPFVGVTIDANGDLFGTTYGGGAANKGTVWEITKGSGTITTLASFDVTNGANPVSGVSLDGNGNLYGVASGGGANGLGTAWEIAKGSGTITTLASFNGTNGSGPLSVSLDANGNLYGVTGDGGASSLGTAWEIAKGSGTITTLASFNSANGNGPGSSIALDAQGDLFGTAVNGGANSRGTVWEIVQGSNSITTLASFNGTDGAAPFGVSLGANGNLFGTTADGGAYGDGTVWELAQGSSAIATLGTFNGANGLQPLAGVALGANGDLFGTTAYGGTYNSGTVWEIQGASVPEPSSIVTGLIGLALAGGFVVANRSRSRR